MTTLNDLVPVTSIPNLNKNLSSASEETMIEILGRPHGHPTASDCHNDLASATVKRLQQTRRMTPNFRLTGIKPALDDVEAIMKKIEVEEPELHAKLSTAGMLCVRLRRPTSGAISTKLSNHAWGTAIDFNLIGHDPPVDSGGRVPRWVAILVPRFNAAGWFSGIAFSDDMHFEVAEETIRRWKTDGRLDADQDAPLVTDAAPETPPTHVADATPEMPAHIAEAATRVRVRISKFFSGIFRNG